VRAVDYEAFIAHENGAKEDEKGGREGKQATKDREKPVNEGKQAKKANLEWLAYIECCSRARISQIMALVRLPVDLQEDILFLEAGEGARDLVTEGDLRDVVKVQDREEQRRRWAELLERRENAASFRKGGKNHHSVMITIASEREAIRDDNQSVGREAQALLVEDFLLGKM
jgi:hypothetical protein